MKWFELHARLPNHPKTRRLAELLDVDIASAVGHLVMMWSWCCDNAKDGNLTGQANRDTARAFGWYGDPALLFRSLIAAGWLDQKAERLKVHDWQEYGGKRLKAADRQRKLAAERQRKHRARKAKEAPPVEAPVQPAQPTLPLEAPATKAKAAKEPKAPKVYEPAVHDLCARLADAIAAYCGERPKVNDEWLRDMERLVRLDKHDADDVAALITWAFARSDGYWPPHLAKPVKLRKHWQTLKMQMTRDAKVVAHPAAGGSTAVGPVQPARRGSINLGTDEQDAEIRAFLEKRGAQ